jgi:hypothetical protein
MQFMASSRTRILGRTDKREPRLALAVSFSIGHLISNVNTILLSTLSRVTEAVRLFSTRFQISI